MHQERVLHREMARHHHGCTWAQRFHQEHDDDQVTSRCGFRCGWSKWKFHNRSRQRKQQAMKDSGTVQAACEIDKTSPSKVELLYIDFYTETVRWQLE